MVSFWEDSVWRLVVALGILFVSMLVCNMLRRLIKPLKKSMIPAPVLAGFLCLIFAFIWRTVTGNELFDEVTLEALTYHGLGLGIVAMTFCRTGARHNKNGARDIVNSGLLTVSTYLLQAVVGLAITIGLSFVLGNWKGAGVLLPMGYGQGPGNAYGWGLTYETATAYPAFSNGASFGLSVAAMGFISASIGGVIYLQHIRRKGKFIAGDIGDNFQTPTLDVFTDDNEIPVTESLDKLTVQFGLVFLAYICAYIFNRILSGVFDSAGGILQNTVKPLLWNFIFLVAMMFVAIIKGILNLGKKKNIIKREYINNYLMNRISGFLFDLMAVASIAAISLNAFRYPEFVIPLAAICIAGFLISFFYVRFICNRLFADYKDEQFLIFFGMLTGTNCTGYILLREVDPFYRTPASRNLIFQNLWATVFGAPFLLLLGILPTSDKMTYICWGIFAAYFLVVQVILFRRNIFGKKKAA